MSKTRIVPPAYAEGTENKLSETQREDCKQIARLLYGAFGWGETEEGYDFWKSVKDRLVAISNGEAL